MRQSFALPPPTSTRPSTEGGRASCSAAARRGRARGRTGSSLRASPRRAIGHVALAQAALATGALDAARAEAARRARDGGGRARAWSTQAAILPYLDLVKGPAAATERRYRAAGRTQLEDVARGCGHPRPRRLDAGALRAGIDRPRRCEAADWPLAESMARQMLDHDRAPAATTRWRSWPSSAATPRPRTSRSPPPAAVAHADDDLPELQRLRRAVASR